MYNAKTWNDNDPSTWKWNIDHIISHSFFKYTSPMDLECRKAWALANLRPLSSKQNVSDGVRLIDTRLHRETMRNISLELGINT